MQKVFTFLRNALLVLLLVLALALAGNALLYLNFDPTYGFLRLKQQAIATGWYLPAYYAHVLIGGIILVVGFFQLHPASRHKFRKLHRMLGYVYVVGILLFAAPGGLVMSFFINRGPWVQLSFLAQVSLWFYFTTMAIYSIRQRKIAEHGRWMWRSFALTLAAITLRVYIFITSYHYDLSQPQAYATLAWLSWVPNLLVVEFYLIRSKSGTQHTTQN